jgi:Sugar-transfer associated ATP-grasp
MLGTYQYGNSVSARYGIGIATQFLQLLAESMRTGISFDEFYLDQMYLPNRWRSRKRQVPTSQSRKALIYLNARKHSHLQFIDYKHLFVAHCKQAGLPTIPLVAEFVDGRSDELREGLPARDLFSKPVNRSHGEGALLWRYDRGRDCFFNAENDEIFSREALLRFLCDLSLSGRILLQKRLINHAALSSVTNGALSTVRIVTCIAPSGSIDLMLPIIRMPTGRSVVDNFTQGGLKAPIDLASGTVCGAALRRDSRLGVISSDKHPDTGQEFKGFPIPMWTETVDLARRAHAAFLSVHFIGWDIAILQNGPVLVEANTLPDLTTIEYGMTLSDTQFIPYYNYHWANSVR